MSLGRGVRPWLPRAMLIAALAAATTVLVSWGLAMWLPVQGASKHFNAIRIEATPVRWMQVIEVKRPGMLRRVWRPWMSTGGSSTAYEDAAKLPIDITYNPRQDRSWGALPRELAEGNPAPRAGMDDARGWPWPALWCEVDAPAMDAAPGRRAVRGGFWLGGADSAKCRALPLVPRWRGLVMDAGVYGAGWLVALVGLGAARRWLRGRRGRCARCGYPLQEGRCTECGWAREAEGAGLTRDAGPANPEPCA